MSFFVWRVEQQARRDAIGRFAAVVCADPRFPRSSRLYKLLNYYPHSRERRALLKIAHRAWRRMPKRPVAS